MKKFKVTFYPDNKSVEVTEGTDILSAAISCGIYINSPCAGDGVCGKCKVSLKNSKGEKASCLACRTLISEDIEVDIPLGSRLDSSLSSQDSEIKYSSGNFGLALDIGTTTISAQLINLENKKTLGTKTSYNKQASFGADIITRIIYAGQKDGLEKLHNAVSSTVNQLIRALALENKVNVGDITSIICAGNTTMIHLLLKMDPAYIRKDSYTSFAKPMPLLKASQAGIIINPRGMLYCIPGIASYVGGDTTSGILSSRLYKQKELSLLIDIGTNGEIALGNEEFMVASAASAGPAFEGSGLTCGMRAFSGAIENVTIDSKSLSVNYKVIGDAKPLGICGSGYISLLCSMFLSGVIDRSGKIIAEDKKRVRNSDYGREFVVVFKDEAGTEGDIVIAESDIENLKRAKAAIYSALSILIKHMNFTINDVKKVFISGGFGTSLDIDSAILIGLLPDLKKECFSFIGNSALAGANEVLLSLGALKEAEEIAGKVTYFDLSTDPGYMDEYMAALFFPHTDLSKFPSAKKLLV